METVGRYRITRRLGAGGMAEVLEAVAGDERFSRRVAIKRALPELAADRSFGRRFLDEARIASRLHNANIVSVLDYGIVDGVPFQVLEFVDGIDAKALSTLGRESGKRMPAAVALHICAEVAHGLEHAHQATDSDGQNLGVIHRDVSPSNVLVSWDGDVKLTDFGIAFAKNRLETTQVGVALGKGSYMAPEQLAEGGVVDARADVFALGCTLHALICGESPLANPRARARLEAGSPLELDPSVIPEVGEIVLKATSLQKKDRYAGAGEMAAALGKTVAALTGRDGRSVLKEWLGPLRTRPAKGQTDAALEVEFVLQPGDGDTTRRFAVTGSTAVMPDRTARVAAPARRPSRAAWAVAAVLIALAGGAAVLRLPASGQLPPIETATPAGVLPAATATEPAGPAVTVTVAMSAPTETPRHRATPIRSLAASVPTPSPATAIESALQGKASLAIGGPGALKAEILVDGKPTGTFAPAVMDLPVGVHEVSLRASDGHQIGAKTVALTLSNTRLAPYRWIIP